jgi:hypothetical protein
MRPDLGPAERRQRIDDFLLHAGADAIPHPGGTLRDHLHRTADRLAAWGAPGWVVDAGRLHAAYGTDGFAPALASPDDRGVVEGVVGARAERLVHLYDCCDRSESYPTFGTPAPVVVDRWTGRHHRPSADQLRWFVQLTVANELDVTAHNPAIRAEHGPSLAALFTRWRPLLSADACAAVDDAF